MSQALGTDWTPESLGDAVEIRVTGTVQGVGFRPTVWRLATEEHLGGEVLNDSRGVLIRAYGHAEAIARFLRRLRTEAPPLSEIEGIHARRLAAPRARDGFEVVASVGGDTRTRVTPDAAMCAACRAEVLDPDQRRHGYPFTNCTHCGPRFSIVDEMPYDRARTTMARFPMCDACRAEYECTTDRRFHAQPIACDDCGPHVWLEPLGDGAASEADVVRRGEAIERAAQALLGGRIVAIRGLGGFHLACDATDADAVQRLRQRKHRYGKPLAIMATDAAVVRRFCRMSEAEQALFESAAAPIVVLEAAGQERLPESLAGGLDTLGFMSPYTPVHLLLMRRVQRPLVMTSGNISHEPQVTELAVARERLAGIADLALMHDRDIANRIDDSVVRVVSNEPRLLRRARGYAPAAIRLPPGFAASPPVLAYGGEQKAAFCLLVEGAAILSQHQGDLEDLDTYDDYRKNLRLYTDMYEHRPERLVADLHPEYLSTKLALEAAAHYDRPLTRVQHHHAHIAGCMAEHGIPRDTPPVLGVALDGLGFGTDGTIWGGEFLLTQYHDYRRLGSLAPVAMPGGVQAILQPWRNLYAHLARLGGWSAQVESYGGVPVIERLSAKPLSAIDRMIHAGINSRLASSCGRLFDAVAAAVGFCFDRVDFQAQGAMQLEAAASEAGPCPESEAYPFALEHDEAGLLRLEPRPMWLALLDDLRRGASPGSMAARFHEGLALAIARVIDRLARPADAARPFDTVVLSGGCFQNRILLERVTHHVEALGLACLSNTQIPANDGGLALGQAAIVAAQHFHSRAS